MLPLLPTSGVDNPQHEKRKVETINNILTFEFDDSRRRTPAEVAAGVMPVNYSYPPNSGLSTDGRYGVVGDNSTNDYTALQAAINFTRASNERLVLRSLRYAFGTGLTVEMSTYVDGAFMLEGMGYNASPTNGGTCLRYTGNSGAALSLLGSLANNQDGSVKLSRFAVHAVDTNAGNSAGATGINASVLNNAVLDDLFVGFFGSDGFYGEDCFTLSIERGLYFGNFGSGIRFVDAANRVHLRDVLAYANGRDKSTNNQANILIFGSSNASFAPILTNCDVSYSGRQLFAWSASGVANISSISVAGGVATVTTATAHGLSTNDWINVHRCNTAGLGTGAGGKQVTVTSSTVFTYVCTAANGNYTSGTDPTLDIGTQSGGILLFGCYGATVLNTVCEVPSGHGIYIYSDCRAVIVQGGFMLNAMITVDQAENVEISGIRFQGADAGVNLTESGQRATINLRRSTCNFDSGASIARSAFYMEDGLRYGPNAPTANEWFVKDRVYNSTPAVGQPKSWVCTVAGTPGTWVSEGNL